MFRYAIELSYCGTAYFGWQRQPQDNSVQAEIEMALSKLFGLQPMSIVGCGRTDTGVHAHYFVAHVDFLSLVDTQQMVYKLNKMLPADIVIHQMKHVSSEFHARFSATFRTYRYFAHTSKSAFSVNSLQLTQSLTLEKMNVAAQYLVGKQDFTSLSKLHTDVKTNICEVFKAEWVATDAGYYFEITADRFLRNMVRATVGTLMEVGTGKIEPSEVPLILAAKNRGEAKVSVAAKGLFLWYVGYDWSSFEVEV